MTSRNYVALARQYEDDVLDGTIPACKWVRLMCQRNRRDRARARTAAFPYYFDAALAEKRCRQAELFPYIKGPKARVVGRDDQHRPIWNTVTLEPHQCWFLGTLFGWRRVDNDRRRFRIALYLVARKNAKSTLAAIIALLMLADDGESGAECYSLATTRDQAKVIARIAWEMAFRTPQFREYFGIRLGAKSSLSLEVPALAGKFAPLSADAGTLDALDISFAAVDEVHAHRTRDVWDVIDTATGARAQPLILATSTAGKDIAGICYELTTYLMNVLQDVWQDEQFFGVFYTLDEGDDWRDLEALKKANPNYGVSVDVDDLARKIRVASRSPAGVNNFKIKHGNVFSGSAASWMSVDDWRACGAPAIAGRLRALLGGLPCWIGVDLAETRDIMAVQLVFRIPPDLSGELLRQIAVDGRVDDVLAVEQRIEYVTFGRYYLPEATIEGSPTAQIAGWVQADHIIETPGNIADFGRLEDDLVDDVAAFDVQEICFDRALAAAVMQSLQKRLGEQPPLVVIKQSVEVMDPAMKAVERLVLARELLHDGNPVQTWMVGNVVVERNYKDEIYPRKAGGKDSHNKIDGAVALFNAIARAYEPGEVAAEDPVLVTA
jgi:phage terminase large subunit-like protein